MKFNITVEDKGPSLVVPTSVAVTEEMKQDMTRIKSQSKRNAKLFNSLTRQFLAQLIAKFDAGEFDEAT